MFRNMIFSAAMRAWLLTLLVAGSCSQVAARDVLIRIVGTGGSAKYIEEGVTTQQPVDVTIGDTVVWRNEGNRTHTATADDEQGNFLFHTGDIPRASDGNFPESDPIEMTAEIFENAGGTPGEPASILYYCEYHGPMESTLVLREASTDGEYRFRRRRRAGRTAARDDSSLKIRRDVTTLSAADLIAYRDAWRRVQGSGIYANIAGNHGCPDQYCHQPGEGITFLAWHREYIARMEQALGRPLHYWDWTSSASAVSGIPHAFTDSTYRSFDGNSYPNPLRSYTYRCPPGAAVQTTSRSPRPAFFLRQYGRQVRRAYLSTTYSGLNGALENPPHDSVHGWVGSSMASVWSAAYDPIFWAHHANVDRQWASWQHHGGADPPAGVQRRRLRGFGGRTVGDVVNPSDLGYEYDRYDSMPPSLRSMFVETDSRESREAAGGVGKTFTVRLAPRGEARGADVPLDLYVRGIPEHSHESYFVYVFVNQPAATPEDATERNPNFVGTFAVFGMGGSPEDSTEEVNEAHRDDNARKPRRVLTLPRTATANARGALQITLVTTGSSGAVIARRDVPFTGVQAVPAGSDAARVDDGAGLDPGDDADDGNRRTFEGVSNIGSYDEAYQDAVARAQRSFSGGGADRIILTEVVSVTGRHGGIAGFNVLKVTIRARLQ